jgi:hypothetical protein
MTQRDGDKHRAGGPGKASKEGHVDPGKRNKPGQKQTPRDDGPGGGGGGTRGVPPEERRDAAGLVVPRGRRRVLLRDARRPAPWDP